jgi:hypothetical protein
MALESKPAWVVQLKERLSRPYSAEERERLRDWTQRIERFNAGRAWPPGTFQRLLDLARVEDAQRGECRCRLDRTAVSIERRAGRAACPNEMRQPTNDVAEDDRVEPPQVTNNQRVR